MQEETMLKNVTFECSLKPFKSLEEGYIRSVCEKIFLDWKPLCQRAETVSIMFWAGDGSEILDYQGNMEAEFDWASMQAVPIPV